jgi:hypothetical protein
MGTEMFVKKNVDFCKRGEDKNYDCSGIKSFTRNYTKTQSPHVLAAEKGQCARPVDARQPNIPSFDANNETPPTAGPQYNFQSGVRSVRPPASSMRYPDVQTVICLLKNQASSRSQQDRMT